MEKNKIIGCIKGSIKIVTVYRRYIFQVESHYTTSRPLSKVKSCQAGFPSGWVTKYEYSVFFASFPFEGDIKDCRTPSLA